MSLFGLLLFFFMLSLLLFDYAKRNPTVKRHMARSVVYTLCFLFIVLIFAQSIGVSMRTVAALSALSMLASIFAAILCDRLGLL